MTAQLFPADTVFSVTDLTSVIKDLLEGAFVNINLEGEISGYRPNSSGHLYFTLKDENAQISAVMFRGKASSLSFIPKDGLKVRCTGTISVYAPRGSYQIVVSKMEIAGEGNILQILEERKNRLAKEGLFDAKNKVKIPFFPKTIAVITSPTGAALRDILQITKRRNPSVNVIILPAVVQGNEAAKSIATQIKAANDFNLADTLIVGRGGGSIEDLLPFSEEIVVRAVAQSKIPIISAVGHEIDWALCDYAADYRAPTPSAAAELAVPQIIDIKNDLNGYKNELLTVINSKVEKMKLMIKSFNPESLEMRFRTIEQPYLMRLDNAKRQLEDNINEKIKDIRQKLKESVQTLEGASPKTILSRGYSMVKTLDGKIVRSSLDVKPEEKIEIYPAQGKISATVNA
ncbi:exodeoxyribonuclease VII large subunit [Treponema pectinovorum]|uniref:exodeoxyribonuclease VII large subunit n=1 Tax=Treponema pectinovorum TaxID=164 RepID=UPI0011F37240|nr:exodeoxyribonuclease VII large subunit [Treponema pectinovorum]